MSLPFLQRLHRRPFLLAAATSLVAAARLDAAEVLRVGSEFLVNSSTANLQAYASVALDADGDFVVAWGAFGDQDGSERGVFARRFNSSGVPQGAEFQVNSYTPGAQDIPSVSLDAGGGFVIAWTGYGGQDGSDNGIFAKRFNAAGVAQAAEFQVNVYTAGHQLSGAVSLGANGDFVVAWTSFSTNQDGSGSGIFARRFSAAGVAQAEEFQANSFTPGDQETPSVSLDADADFVVAWTGRDGQDGDLGGAFARRFDSSGIAQADEFEVNSYTMGDQSGSSVALDADGDFVVVWNGAYGQDGSAFGVFARRFDSSGVPQAAEFQINTYVTGSQASAPSSVSLEADGDLVVAWQSVGQDGSNSGVFGRRFGSSGFPDTGEFQVNAYTTNGQMAPAVSVDDSGGFVVAWHGSGQGDSDTGVFAQRFKPSAVLDIDGNGETGALTDGLLVVRFLFGFTNAALVSGAVDLAGCSRCDADTIEAYLETLI